MMDRVVELYQSQIDEMIENAREEGRIQGYTEFRKTYDKELDERWKRFKSVEGNEYRVPSFNSAVSLVETVEIILLTKAGVLK